MFNLEGVGVHLPCEVQPIQFVKIFMFNYTYKHDLISTACDNLSKYNYRGKWKEMFKRELTIINYLYFNQNYVNTSTWNKTTHEK